MEEKCGDGIHSVECLEKNFMALQKKMEEDFSQVESIQTKVKALSADWEERHEQLKIEQEKVTELEAQIKLLNTKQEEVMASLQADMIRAANQIQEKEGLAERLKAEISFLEKRVRAACREAAGSAAELEKGAHDARLALEATLSSLCPQLDREDVVSETLQSEQENTQLQDLEQVQDGQKSECPGEAKGAEATAEEALQGQPQGAVGDLQEELSEARSFASTGL
ncbi:tropomyosin-like isoform X2 [Erythrolamprus reginae]|uniref:tropomyosin-like isoform X2 n=1 Tax=Erythrolamprus reginae TaxID=121349 RepID=UPI00396C4710